MLQGGSVLVQCLYTSALVYMIFQPLSSSRALIESMLGETVGFKDEVSYGEACGFEALKVLVFDRFFFSHSVGNVVLAALLRNPLSMFIVSLGFELLERSFINWCPNFRECWWDSLFLDLLSCDVLGSMLGLYLASRLGMKMIDARKNPMLVIGTSTLTLLSLLNGFFLKSMLRIPAEHPAYPLRAVVTCFSLYYSIDCLESPYASSSRSFCLPNAFELGLLTHFLEIFLIFYRGVGTVWLISDVPPLGRAYFGILCATCFFASVYLCAQQRQRQWQWQRQTQKKMF